MKPATLFTALVGAVAIGHATAYPTNQHGQPRAETNQLRCPPRCAEPFNILDPACAPCFIFNKISTTDQPTSEHGQQDDDKRDVAALDASVAKKRDFDDDAAALDDDAAAFDDDAAALDDALDDDAAALDDDAAAFDEDYQKRDVPELDEVLNTLPTLIPVFDLTPTINETKLEAQDAAHAYINAIMEQLEPIVREKSFLMNAMGFDTERCTDTCWSDVFTNDCRKCMTAFMNVMRFAMELSDI